MLSIIASLLLSSFAIAATPVPVQEGIFNTRSRQWLTVEAAAAEINAATIVVLGEQHVTNGNLNQPESILHHANQLRWLETVNSVQPSAALGMEFLTYPTQTHLNQYLAGALAETRFLELAGWGSNPFEPYKKLLLESVKGSGTIALNAPKALSRLVAQRGPKSLTQEQKAYLPPVWERGSAEYFERFKAAMHGHVSGPDLENYFWAQSLWDDTMAWRATLNSNGPMTIVVGEFHAEFGHGLPARLQRYGARDVRTMIQVAVNQGEDFNQATAADPKYGERADYIWVFTRD